MLKEYLGDLPLSALEPPDEINRFKTESDYAEDVEIATMHRALETLRAAMNWGMAQTPPLFNRTPFHRFGVRLNKKAETTRDRRLTRDEEKRLLDAALQKMNAPEHQYVGPMLHDRIIGALELCCRRGEMLLVQNKRVNWETCQIGIPGATAKDRENRRIPFNPKGRLAAILERRLALGPEAYVFGTAIGGYQENIQTAWETLQLIANGIEPKPGREGAAWEDRSSVARLEARGSESAPGGWSGHPHHPANARPREHSTDPALLERDGRRTQERTGSELEERRPTASTSVRKLIGLLELTACLQNVSTRSIFWLRGGATSGTCSCGAA